MRTIIEEYAYVYIKIAGMKRLLFSNRERILLRAITDLDNLVELLKKFYPNFQPKSITIADIERELWIIYFKIYERILAYSPSPMQIFLKNYLMKYEIANLRLIITGIIAGLTTEERNEYLYLAPAEILERKNFLRDLLNAQKLEDITMNLDNGEYAKVIKEGIKKYQETQELFFLYTTLDKYFYQSFFDALDYYPKQERRLIKEYIQKNIDFYNLNLLYRIYWNKFKIQEISDYIIMEGFYLNADDLKNLVTSENIEVFFAKLKAKFRKNLQLYRIIQNLESNSIEGWQDFSEFLLNPIQFSALINKEEDITLQTIIRILRIIFLKEKEIQEIVTRAVQISYPS